MKSFLKSLAVLVFLPSWSWAATPAEELSDKLRAIETFSARFEQRIFDKNQEELQKTEGRVRVKNPGRFHWEVKPPFEQVVITNGIQLWVYDPDMEQVTVYQKQQLDSTPAQILSGDFETLGQRYQVTRSEGKNNSYRMAPNTDQGNEFASLEFVFDKKGTLAVMVLTDKLDQRTEVRFSKQLTNKTISDSLFEFTPPDGVDVIVSE